MKIEKVNDNQIRCTLTREDLANRQLKISELAYGTEKAKNLFRDMMQQASFECGFEAEDIPLMIEAIPLFLFSCYHILTIRYCKSRVLLLKTCKLRQGLKVYYTYMKRKSIGLKRSLGFFNNFLHKKACV